MCIENNCNNKVNERYNGYCYKHRRKYLINEVTNTIKMDIFTNKVSDYLKKDIILTLWNYQNKDNAIMVFHALTGDQFASGKNPVTNKDGWWSYVIGPDKALDTNKYFIICAIL